ncbi:MAG TPA: cytochrome c oxidase assembly factor Coa1 family protein [Myxococcales bacterium]|nr:cytochrome c oxidase assembly factor Coa1 family protein [Myxococcales bacterium]
MDQTIPQGGWWSRNWKWFVPAGCLSLLLTCGCCIGGGFYMFTSGLARSRAYQEALARAKADPDVQAALGTPIDTTPGFGTSLNIAVQNGETITRARVPLRGPKGEGSLHVEARERGKDLTFDRLEVEVGPKVIHLPGAQPSTHPTGPDGAGGDIDLDQEPDEGGTEVTLEAATDRPGADFRDYEVPGETSTSRCAADCSAEPRCKAYTFVKPAGGKPGRCRLKDRAPAKVKDACCESGVKK